MIFEIIQWVIIIGSLSIMWNIYNYINDYAKTINEEISRLFRAESEHNISKIIKVVRINSTAKLPYKGSKDAAGYDLCASLEQSNILIPAHETVKINTGLKMEIPKGYAGLIYARSGLATKEGLAPANKVGVVDSDYRGEIIVALHNHTNEDKVINNGDRIAQLVITPFKDCVFYETNELSETKRGDGGFGSSGK